MVVNYTVRRANVGDIFKERAQKKLDKFDRFFESPAGHVTVSQEKDRFTVEVTITTDDMVYRSERTSSDVLEGLDDAISSIFRQINKNKSKLERQLRSNSLTEPLMFKEFLDDFDGELESEEDFKIVKNKRFIVKPSTVDEAILQMNMLDHEFYLFRNGETGEINVVYKRNDGDYGLLEPESI